MSTEEKTSALREPWTALLAGMPGAPIFLTWEWMSTWWRHYGHGRELWLLTARNTSGELIGLAPLMLTPYRGGSMRLRRIRFVGSGLVCPCHIDIIARPEEKESVSAAFLSYLYTHRKEWNVIDLENVTQDCALKSHIVAAGDRYRVKENFLCPFISLPDSWNVYHDGLKKKLQRNLRYFRARLERDHPGQVTFRRVTEVEEVHQALDLLTKMHQQRWHAKKRMTCFDNDQYVGFHHDMAALALKRNWLRFYQLKVGNQVIATLYCFRYRDTFYAYQIGFVPDWGMYSPGRLLIAHVIQEAIKEGAREFDWLRGGHEYKFAWTGQMRTNTRFLSSASWQGRLWLSGMDILRPIVSIGKRALPRDLRWRTEKFLFTKRARNRQ